MNEEYRVVIGAKLNGKLCYFDLDTCTERALSSTATVPQYPVQDGVTVADHMYRNARSLNLSGQFSLAGRNSYEGNNFYTKDNIIGNLAGGIKSWDQWFKEDADELKDLSANNRLEAIQKVFEYIQAKGILCTVMMCSGKLGGTNTRFKVRDNMALTSISWREQYNSMTFSFGFTEVITVSSLGEFETFDYDGLYPSTTLPATRSLGDVMRENGTIYQTVLEALFNANYIDIADGQAYRLKGVTMGLDAGGEVMKRVITGVVAAYIAAYIAAGTVAGATAIGTVLGVSGTTVLASAGGGPIGLAIGLAIAAEILYIAGAIAGIQALVRHIHLKQGFNLVLKYKDYIDPNTFELKPGADISAAQLNDSDLVRLRMLLEDVQAAVDAEITNISFYSLPDADSAEVPAQVGVDSLTLRITQGTAEQPFSMQILKGLGANAEPVAPMFGDWCVEGNLTDMDESSNIMYKDSSRQYSMYLYNPYLNPEFKNMSGLSVPSDAETNLSNYYVVVVKGNIKDSMKKLSDVIKDVLSNRGYRT